MCVGTIYCLLPDGTEPEVQHLFLLFHHPVTLTITCPTVRRRCTQDWVLSAYRTYGAHQDQDLTASSAPVHKFAVNYGLNEFFVVGLSDTSVKIVERESAKQLTTTPAELTQPMTNSSATHRAKAREQVVMVQSGTYILQWSLLVPNMSARHPRTLSPTSSSPSSPPSPSSSSVVTAAPGGTQLPPSEDSPLPH